MTILVAKNKEELEEMTGLIPYPVYAVSDPDTLAYPAAIKFVLTHDIIGDVKQAVVYVIPFDSRDLLDFYEVFAKHVTRTGIEGYEYAESTTDTAETNQGTRREVQTAFDISNELSSDGEVRASFVYNNDN